MEIKLFTLVTLWACGVLAYEYRCSQQSAKLLLKRSTYEFSMKLLQRVVQDTDSHFVYSPMSTWLQLTALAEGAVGDTLNEIANVTQHHRNKCFKRQFSHILRRLDKDLRFETRRKCVIVVDKLMGVEKKYVREVQRLYGVTVLPLDFNEPKKSAMKVNHLVDHGTGGVVDQIVYYDDFMSTMLLMSDANCFRSEWLIPFNSGTVQPFYSNRGFVGNVSMMNQVGNFHMAYFPHIGATVLEVPCANPRITMLVFMMNSKTWVGELFYRLEKTTLTSIFNKFKYEKLKLVNVTMPKIKQRTEVENLPELVADMGITRIFDYKKAELRGISKYDMYASLMTQITNIDINENGIRASVGFLVKNKNQSAIEYLVNRPFAYMIVDKETYFILYAGVYTTPSVV